jgi:hypothetical protein
MRVGPLGLLAWRHPTAPATSAAGVLSSHLTHQAPRCKEACAALAVAVAAAAAAAAAGADPVAGVLEALAGARRAWAPTDFRGMLEAMLAAGPGLQAAADAMHAAVPMVDEAGAR